MLILLLRLFYIHTYRLPKETETTKASGSEDGASSTDVSTVVVNSSDTLMESLEQQTNIDESPKLEQILMETLTAAVTSASSNTSVTSSLGLVGYQHFGANGSSSAQSLQNTNDPPEMPQLLNILNELLDGQDLSSLTHPGGNGDHIQDMVDQEENYEEDSPRKEDPDEIQRLIVQQRLDLISREEQQLQRKMDFLIRRLYKFVARQTGLHVSEEIAGFVEHVARHNRKKEKQLKEAAAAAASSAALVGNKFPCLSANLQGTLPSVIAPLTPLTKPPVNLLSSPSTHQIKLESRQQPEHQEECSAASAPIEIDVIELKPDPEPEPLRPVPLNEMKTFLRRIDNVSTMQHTLLNKRVHALKYFSKPSASMSSANTLSQLTKSETNLSNSIIARFDDGDVDQLEQVSGLLMSEMRLIEKQIDSDATLSSSGGESADELVPYNNQYQQPLSM